MKFLALETATEACSAALWDDGRVLARFAHAPRGQTELLLPMVDELLAEAGIALGALKGIAYSCGPGAFTGVRIAAAMAQGLALGADLPVLPVSTLQTAAQGAYRLFGAGRVLVVFDARMDEVYLGAFELGEHDLMQPVAPERLGPPALVPVPEGAFFAVGNGLVHYATLAERCTLTATEPGLMPNAEDILPLALPSLLAGQGLAPELALPVYLRDEVWQKMPGK